MSFSYNRLKRQIDQAMACDRHRLLQRLRRKPAGDELARLQADIEASVARRARRAAQRPRPKFSAELPVIERREDIAEAIAHNQVVIVCGETGSGKTTQLPQICLDLGRGVAGLIGHTQPRRLAARSVARRIAEELDSPLGEAVGYKVRFSDQVSEQSYIKLMTDGILLAETQHDRFLSHYDTLIIDEAHERSLNIDFLLGYLKQLLPRRPDLKLIITSATIDPQRFSRHFGDAPIIEVSGRTYPVEIRYRPLAGEDERDEVQAIVAAVDELAREGPGDVLVFLAGERQIRETAEALRKHHPPATEILPLYARLGAAEQARVFRPHRGRRIVLATNVAETSLTVPGIRYVVDPGRARISRYSYRSKIQRLPIEPISQASANQRSGRCGRVSAGIAIRLYAEEDYQARPAFTEPEIQRTSLASVILQMAALKLGEVEDFPFVDPPDPRYIRDGYKLLQELGAVDAARAITSLGRRLARLPLDPRLGRMILAAGQEGCVDEVLVICAALSIQDPRERPFDKSQAADEQHRRFNEQDSDFLAYLALWRYYREQERHLSQNKLRKLCKKEFLSYNRLREWRDIWSQLKRVAGELGLRSNTQPAPADAIHRALLSGLLANVGLKHEKHEYLGARNSRFHLFPGSALAKKPPTWLMAAEIVETRKVYARTVARIEPAWIEQVGAHLLKRSYHQPHWEKRAGRVVAFERVTLYGLVLVARRKVNYGPLDPAEARRIFIRAALVAGELNTRAAFHRHNRALLAQIEGLEAKARRQDVLVDEEALAAFFDQRLPAEIHSATQLERWLKQDPAHDERLKLDRATVMREDATLVSGEQFPDQLLIDGLCLPLRYRLEPGSEQDGVIVRIPLAVLAQLRAEPFQWLVPGLLEEKVAWLIKSLPKRLRRHFVPVPHYARACVEAMKPGEGSLTAALARQLQRIAGIEVGADAWRDEELPAHLRMYFEVVDAEGRVLAGGSDLAALQARLQTQAGEGFARVKPRGLERQGLRSWDFGPLPERTTLRDGGLELIAYPALVDRGETVDLCLLNDADEARRETRAGVRRLFMLSLAREHAYLLRNLPGIERLCLEYHKLGDCQALKQDIVAAVFDQLFLAAGEVRDEKTFAQRLAAGKGELVSRANELCRLLGEILPLYRELDKRLSGKLSPAWLNAVADMREQLQHLVYPGFVLATPAPWLAQMPRYLKALRRRLDKLPGGEARDRQAMLTVAPFWQRYRQRSEALAQPLPRELEHFRWMIEELRVSLFAQELKTRFPVSAKRLEKYWAELGQPGG